MTDGGKQKSGLPTAVRDLMADSRPERQTEQLSLLATPAAADMAADPAQAQRAGPGRPAGSRNKSTQEWVDFIVTRYRSPLLFLAETYTRPVEQLAAELGCDRETAFKHQREAAAGLAPYLHQKQPLAVTVDAKGVVQLVIHKGAPGPLPGPEGGRSYDMTIIDGAVEAAIEADAEAEEEKQRKSDD